MGEDALLHAGEEDQREFQALGGVQRHQLHTVLGLVALCLAGLERGV